MIIALLFTITCGQTSFYNSFKQTYFHELGNPNYASILYIKDTFFIDNKFTIYKIEHNFDIDSTKQYFQRENSFWAVADSSCENVFWVCSSDSMFKPNSSIEQFVRPVSKNKRDILAIGLIYFCSENSPIDGHDFSSISYLGKDDTFHYYKATDVSSVSPYYWHHKIGKYNFHDKSIEVCYYRRIYQKDWDKFRENELKDANGKKVNFRISNKFLKRLVKPKFHRYKKYSY